MDLNDNGEDAADGSDTPTGKNHYEVKRFFVFLPSMYHKRTINWV